MANLLLFFAVSLAGIYCHWLKSWLRETIASGFFEYMRNQPKHTGAMLFTAISALLTLHQTGALVAIDQQSIIIAFMTGFTADSAVNKE